MKQVLQNLKTGEITLPELPTPTVKTGHLLIQSRKSLISLGTERMLLEFGKANWINKARQQPDKVKQVLQKMKTDGLVPTVKAVFNKLDQPLPLGYCNVGEVIAVGKGVHNFEVGDCVVSNGPHAEVVSVPENLCAKVPEGVDDISASFTVLSAIALQGVRILQPTLGESVAVIGLGLIGLVTCQILRANGCRVIGFDFDTKKVELAKKFGVEAWNLTDGVDPLQATAAFSRGNGMDGVIITASTSSNDPIEQAPKMCRKRGRVVLVGVIGLKLNRADFYDKEISFQVSCSYGPGRYEENYEGKGLDYPIGFVRWTEQRNFEAILQLMAQESLQLKELVTEVFPFENAVEAYQKADANALGLVFDYGQTVDLEQKTVVFREVRSTGGNGVRVGMVGAGNFTGATLLPALVKTGAELVSIASAGGMSSNHLGKKFGFARNTTDYQGLLNDPEINTLFITTQHNAHAKMVIEGLQAGKHIFVEKPLAMNLEELQEIAEVREQHLEQQLMIGFNRRFSPLVLKMRKLLKARQSPLSMVMIVNSGQIPADHWTQDPEKGGGRIIGEACHFIDLLRFLAGDKITSVSAVQLGDSPDQICEDKMSIQLTFRDGSIGTVHYFSNGDKGLSKERLEVFSEGRVLQLDNFNKLTGHGFSDFRKMSLTAQDKGHDKEMFYFVKRIKEGGAPLISFEELENVTRASFAAIESAKGQGVIKL